jgi:hypothetical protein
MTTSAVRKPAIDNTALAATATTLFITLSLLGKMMTRKTQNNNSKSPKKQN